MFIKIVLLSVALISIALLAFAVRVIFVKNGLVSASSVGDSTEMKKRKIYCPEVMQKIEDKKIRDATALSNGSCKECPVQEEC